MRVSEKHGRFGLGCHPISRHPAMRRGKKFSLVRFSSAGYQLDSSIAVVDGVSSKQCAVSGLIRKCPPGFKLDNWTSIVVPVVFSDKI